MADAALPLVAAGVFDRFPDLRLVFAHVDAGWTFHWMEFMDITYIRHRHLDFYKLRDPDALPSEYIRKHILVHLPPGPHAVKYRRRSVPSSCSGPATFPTTSRIGRTTDSRPCGSPARCTRTSMRCWRATLHGCTVCPATRSGFATKRLGDVRAARAFLTADVALQGNAYRKETSPAHDVTDGRAETLTDGRLVTRELAEWVAGTRFEDLPDAVVAEAGRALADYLGESLFVGATKPWGQSIAAFCAAHGGGQPEATIIATGRRPSHRRAALANGTMALGFEYADFGAGSRPYPFAVTGPLALAEAAAARQRPRPRDRHRL